MATSAPQPPIPAAGSRSSPAAPGGTSHGLVNGHGDSADAHASTVAPPPATTTKKGKKKAADPNETGKLLAAKINQLELDAAGEKDQEAEIEREVKKANRDLSNLLNGMETPLSRLEVVQKKYTELLADMKRLDRDNMKSKKRADQLQKEKDQGRSELGKTITIKEKLEKLCRELSRENKKMKDEHKRLEDTEKRSRHHLGESIESLLLNIEHAMKQKENPESQKLNMELDELFRQKFKSFIEQYELRELHFQSLMRTKECEVQYNLARYEQQRKEAENQVKKSQTLTAQVSTFSQTETELRSQLNIYVEKFKQVEDTLNNSNDLFLTFRKEMEEMSKKTKRLEKENLTLTRKHDLTNRNILEMAEERTRSNKELETLRKKNSTLESVIRRMQEQGRAPAGGNILEGSEEDEASDYDEDEEYEEDDSQAEDYDDEETEDDADLQARQNGLAPTTYGPVPPPPPSAQPQVNGKVSGSHGQVNGIGKKTLLA
ncbi:MAG: hypothetical protein Q9191_003934 [Dirinaria sp. TL-2023a]